MAEDRRSDVGRGFDMAVGGCLFFLGLIVVVIWGVYFGLRFSGVL